MSEFDSRTILQHLRDGRESAAEWAFTRYVSRLTALVRSKLSPLVAARTDADDVVLSAYRSFFIGAREDKYVLQRSGDLWRLLVAITLNKVRRHERTHRAEKRSVESESNSVAEHLDSLGATSPTPDQIAALSETLTNLFESLDPFACRVLELRLQGARYEEIATDTCRSERSVRRAMNAIKGNLAQRVSDE